MSNQPRLPAMDPEAVPAQSEVDYPEPFRIGVENRVRRRLGDAAGLTNFGVNLVTLPPGGWSSQRHWHRNEDEFVWIVEGELTLITDAGEQTLRAGMAAGFPAGVPDGHHLVNKSGAPATYLEIGDRAETEEGIYPDIDLRYRHTPGGFSFTNRAGEPLEETKP